MAKILPLLPDACILAPFPVATGSAKPTGKSIISFGPRWPCKSLPRSFHLPDLGSNYQKVSIYLFPTTNQVKEYLVERDIWKSGVKCAGNPTGMDIIIHTQSTLHPRTWPDSLSFNTCCVALFTQLTKPPTRINYSQSKAQHFSSFLHLQRIPTGCHI